MMVRRAEVEGWKQPRKPPRHEREVSVAVVCAWQHMCQVG
jgi:hypothetical protein